MRIWRAFGLQPHRVENFKFPKGPQFVEKVRDIVGLYLNPPDRAIVLCVDEKSQVQALNRTEPILPLAPAGVTSFRTWGNQEVTAKDDEDWFTADFRCVPKVTVKDASAFTRATFVVDDGVRGMRQTFDNPSRAASAGAVIAPRSNAEKIRDTIRSESH